MSHKENDKIHDNIADRESAKIDQAELYEEDWVLREYEQREIDETLVALEQSISDLRVLFDKVITGSQERNKIVIETIEKLTNLVK